eukprot:gene4751-5001_t
MAVKKKHVEKALRKLLRAQDECKMKYKKVRSKLLKTLQRKQEEPLQEERVTELVDKLLAHC